MTVSDWCWSQPPANAALFEDDVHLWYSSLDIPAAALPRLYATLDSNERARAECYCFEVERVRFVVGRGLLRRILGRYLDVEPSDLRFEYSSRGKPSLREGFGGRIRFSLAHSGGYAIYAITLNRRIGVDLERIVPVVELEQIANRFFSDREKTALQALAGDEQHETFFKIWTAKEAYLKACEKSLANPLSVVDVPVEPIAPCSLRICCDMREDSRWSLEQLRPASDFMAALVVEGCNYRLACWRWPDLDC